ncbi:MAG: crossover junction endodeoxyribonuclease RuvC [Chloroflexi bacterium]|nr:crossover junction endodeoxyribonuclease RuvC [Chloroflexota bacterium]
MLFLGIDPGIARCGYGLVEELRNGELKAIAYGVIETPKTDTLPQRLLTLHEALRTLISQWQPAEAAVEELFFAKNVTTALTVGHARGVVLLTLQQQGLLVAEYTPMEVKQAVSGYGGADKKQMQEMVRMLLHLEKIPRPDDAADALAVAVTHAHSRRMRNRE